MMNMKANAALLSCLLLAVPSLFADHDKGKKEEGKREDEKIERKVKIERNEDRVKIERRERDDEDRVKIERRDRDDEEGVRARRVVVVPANRIVIINNDVNRLETLLQTAQGTTVVFTQPTLLRVGNEAVVLARRIAVNVAAPPANSNAVSAARLLRMHIRQMRAAALRGDVVAVRLHAREALPFAIRIDTLM
jgi:hypothetical protein